MQAILPAASNERVDLSEPGGAMATDPLINRTFDRRYLILRKLGSGGMADVYLAEDEELGRQVALKLLNDRHARDEQFVERFRREAQNAAGLNHPNIVRSSTAARPRAPTTSRWSSSTGGRSRSCSSATARRRP